MTNPATTSLLDRADLDRDAVRREVARGLSGADDGELFLEYGQTEALMFDNGRLKQATYDTSQGFGLRAVKDDAVGYAHSSDVSLPALIRAADAVHAVRGGYSGTLAAAPTHTNVRLYGDDNPLDAPGFEAKVKLLAEIDAYVRDKDPRVRQVTASLSATWQVVEILRPDGESYRDIRPLVRVNVSVVAGQGDRQESGSKGYGGREGYARFIETKAWRDAADGAIREALVNLESVPAPAGEMDVVLGAGWPGVMLHEAVGHGLEGDFNRKQTSAFAGLMGQQVAARGVTVVDDGTMAARRGSLSIDDEGTPTNRTVLIEDGILVGYMQDRQNARLMNMKATGNGRRESHAHVPMPRMTNTYMTAGDRDPAEILASVKNGVYCVNLGGGQVDITSGKYVFQCTETYRIENGKLGAPLKGGQMQRGGGEQIARPGMRHDQNVLHFGHVDDLPRHSESAAAREIGLQDVDSSSFDQLLKAPFRDDDGVCRRGHRDLGSQRRLRPMLRIHVRDIHHVGSVDRVRRRRTHDLTPVGGAYQDQVVGSRGADDAVPALHVRAQISPTSPVDGLVVQLEQDVGVVREPGRDVGPESSRGLLVLRGAVDVVPVDDHVKPLAAGVVHRGSQHVVSVCAAWLILDRRHNATVGR
jgi:TldD protein